MKELSIEEKARAYDEAKARMSKAWNDNRCTLGFMNEIFPELKGSEDERIRKAIHIYLDWLDDRKEYAPKGEYTIKDMIAWLEKQGNLMKALQISNAEIGELIEKNYYLKEQLEKQGQNNMGISEATKQKLEDNLNKALEKETPESCNEFLDEQGEHKSIDDLTPQEVMDIAVAKCFEQGEQKPAVEMKTPEESLGVDSNTYNKIVDKCIYGEQKPAWSEEDKDFMYDTLSNLTELKDRYGEGYGNVGKCIDWLKSLKERYVWKPSDEQMNAIDYVKNFDYGGYKNMLVSLYYDLKKLK